MSTPVHVHDVYAVQHARIPAKARANMYTCVGEPEPGRDLDGVPEPAEDEVDADLLEGEDLGQENGVVCLALCDTHSCVLAGSSDGTISVWDSKCVCIATLQSASKKGSDGNRAQARAAAGGYAVECLSHRGGLVASVAKGAASIDVWWLELPKTTPWPPTKQEHAHGHEQPFSPSHAGTTAMVLRGHADDVTCVQFSPADRGLLASGSVDQTIKLWRMSRSGRFSCTATLRGHEDDVWDLSFACDGRAVVSVSPDITLRVWGVKHDKNEQQGKGGQEQGVSAHNTDGSEEWKCLHVLTEHSSWINCVECSPMGPHLVATGACDYTVKLWCARMGECRKTLHGHVESVNAICFSQDGLLLASGAHDNTIRLWSAPGHECVHVLAGGDDQQWVRSLRFAVHGCMLVSGHASFHAQGALRFWLVRDEWWSTSNNTRQTSPLRAAAFTVFLIAGRMALGVFGGGGGFGHGGGEVVVGEARALTVWQRCPTEIWLAVMAFTRNGDFYPTAGPDTQMPPDTQMQRINRVTAAQTTPCS